MKQPLLSIVIPVYNAKKSIKSIVTCILREEFKDFELLLINDGSTDNTLAILEEIAEKDTRIKVYDKSNGGPSSARNLGLKEATGQYIQFYDSDDTIPNQALSITTKAIQNTDSDLLISGSTGRFISACSSCTGSRSPS